ncbi:MAG: hypothetical protein ACRDRW_20830 [Pseudonocardiaceae bacterium]
MQGKPGEFVSGGLEPDALREALGDLRSRADETSDDTLSSVITAGQRALDEWQELATSLRCHEQEHERAALAELRARDRLRSVLELLNKLSDHVVMILPPAVRGPGTQRCTDSPLAPGGATRARLTVRMLGGFELTFDGRPVRGLHGRRGLSIIQFLVLNRRYAICRETLIDAIWPEIPIDQGRRRLHQGYLRLTEHPA